MMPIINRGTWTRVFSFRTLINRFIEKFKDESPMQILSLGAGLDANYFYFEESSELFRNNNVKYIEVDFPDITAQKISVIKEHDSLQKLISPDGISEYCSSEDTLMGPKYKLIPCDVREIEVFEEKLVQANVDPTAATLVLSE